MTPSPMSYGTLIIATVMLIDIKAATVRTLAEEPRPVRTGRTKQEPVMTGFPMRKLRKTGAVDQEGNVVIIPRLPSVTGANKPPGWNQWSAAQKEDSNPRSAD